MLRTDLGHIYNLDQFYMAWFACRHRNGFTNLLVKITRHVIDIK